MGLVDRRRSLRVSSFASGRVLAASILLYAEEARLQELMRSAHFVPLTIIGATAQRFCAVRTPACGA
jgi:hypothetical protein